MGAQEPARPGQAAATASPRRVSELTWMVGGQQGEGIDSTGDIVARGLHRMGYFVYGYRHFASRIKGGHTNFKLRVGLQEMRCGNDGLDLLLAFDQESIDHNAHLLSAGATVVFDDSAFRAEAPAGREIRLVGVPMTNIAKESGKAIMKNMVAVGASAALLGLSPEDFTPVLEDRFGKKGLEIVQRNTDLIRHGFDHCRGVTGQVVALQPPAAEPVDPAHRRLFITGNEAIALGALASGCRFLAAYPITPATEIMYWLIEHLPRVGGVVVQCEDEIAAVNMAIGASYAGVRSMTSTSGPGLALMSEAVSLAGMVEIPLVVVDVQRGGPATGLPTKMEQGDLNHLLFGGHGDFPRVVLAPRTVEDCYEYAILAFNVADRYQCLVYIASDLALGMSRQSIRGLEYESVRVDRGLVAGLPSNPDAGRAAGNGHLKAGGGDGANGFPDGRRSALSGAPPTAGLGDPGAALQAAGAEAQLPPFLRYAHTASGVSPRAWPGMPGARHLVTGDEHDQAGQISEDPTERKAQMDKRLGKLAGLDLGGAGVYEDGPMAADLLLVGWGSTFGVIHEIHQRLVQEGHRVAHLQLGILWPFPAERVRARLAGVRKALIIEHSATGQLYGLLRREVGPALPPTEQLLKYDGNPLRLQEVDRRCREVLVQWSPARI